MTEASDATTPEPDATLDADAEQARLDEIEAEDARIRSRADDDLEIGGKGRTFTDQGVSEQVEERGDTDRAPGDGT
ncbi:hypothetical protein BH10ACT1_BH10ACT1_11440 [soil metagenome]